MKCLEITITGKTTDDLELALEEVKRSVSGGNTSGMNGDEDGEFSFDISGSEEEEQGTLYKIWEEGDGWVVALNNSACVPFADNTASIIKKRLRSYADAARLANSLESDANDFVERY